ncbi:carboxyltransferase domain-containing protein [Sulfitobacter albidus]|uniref:Carboxyltransferase domain-containing protein n=1 Tax=Sulfitobacter albidus TaxID=2829501 RepID=A0A975JCN0_9RHOB|nr:carboxyltransferase domain-containing protein [Sulfitobacter albidus]QUJ75988.1 carboxyltransferase domain-containing protein [Sulfitobacter albidus]
MTDFPRIRPVGLSGLLVQFAESMSEPANRAALAFRAAVDSADWPEVFETSTSLVSTFLRVDALAGGDAMTERLETLLASRDWYAAPLPENRTLWHVPTLYGGDHGPQLEEAAEAAGVDADTAVAELSSARLRVITIGFAPGQPYIAELPAHWNIPRQRALSKSVPRGALVVAIRQLVVFTNDTPTGWRHVGQTHFRNFTPASDTPFALSPGDEIVFPSVTETQFAAMADDAAGGAEREAIA